MEYILPKEGSIFHVSRLHQIGAGSSHQKARDMTELAAALVHAQRDFLPLEGMSNEEVRDGDNRAVTTNDACWRRDNGSAAPLWAAMRQDI